MKKTMFALRHYLGVPCANIMTFILCGVGVFVLFVLWYLVPQWYLFCGKSVHTYSSSSGSVRFTPWTDNPFPGLDTGTAYTGSSDLLIDLASIIASNAGLSRRLAFVRRIEFE